MIILMNSFRVKVPNYVEHNHSDQSDMCNEFEIKNNIKKDCIEVGRIFGETNAMSGIRSAFRKGCLK